MSALSRGGLGHPGRLGILEEVGTRPGEDLWKPWSFKFVCRRDKRERDKYLEHSHAGCDTWRSMSLAITWAPTSTIPTIAVTSTTCTSKGTSGWWPSRLLCSKMLEDVQPYMDYDCTIGRDGHDADDRRAVEQPLGCFWLFALNAGWQVGIVHVVYGGGIMSWLPSPMKIGLCTTLCPVYGLRHFCLRENPTRRFRGERTADCLFDDHDNL